ncbi:regulatory signaling modulator protein AmpE [Pseudidiomarina taiwanensis]|uniref:Regulatory signaling modulator protein AmpE n=1 Tax=Pseudidiomarina taiwanensis TaxID=337250 RepID=A0A432ZKS7_9GAMM|nr:regulatory signaling modulator protein AmpE [Pseudidiomarina taiwanensis]RUO78513.1 hypothetical protein CWI83_05670 [Pseudidiomarina taiwanensis]
MQLFAIILAVSLERSLAVGKHWTWRRMLLRWQQIQLHKTELQDWKQNGLGQLVWALIPAFLIGLVLALFDNMLLSFLASTGLLLVAMVCTPARKRYKEYVELCRQLDETELSKKERTALLHERELAAERLIRSAGHRDIDSVQQALLWIHLRAYFAVLLYFILFGIVGALVYATLRDMRRPKHIPRSTWTRAYYLLNWLPTRVMSLGFLFVGNFSKASGLWLSTLGNIPPSNRDALFRVAAAADEITVEDPEQHGATALTTVGLVKRNFLLFIVFVSILTIAGWL